MRLIEQSSKLWGETPYNREEAISWIECAGRTCYRSEDKIVEGSGQKFVYNIWKRKHFSVLEHSNMVIRRRHKSTFPANTLQIDKSVFDSKYFNFCIDKDRVHIGGNWRAWIEFYNKLVPDYADPITLDNITTIFNNDTYDVLNDSKQIPNELKIITVEFVTDRAVTHELVRHRPASYSQESQRYVRYGDIDFIIPSWFVAKDDKNWKRFINVCGEVEQNYKFLLSCGMKAEDARVILPNATATKIVMSASIPEWQHVFNLRVSKAAYPSIRRLLRPVYDEFKVNNWLMS